MATWQSDSRISNVNENILVQEQYVQAHTFATAQAQTTSVLEGSNNKIISQKTPFQSFVERFK